ncbi:MAG: immunity 26/phosphotriesterase HocA family protein, partial [Oscillospiraceae bacterium]
MIDKKALDLLNKKTRSVRDTFSDEERSYCIEKGVLTVHDPVLHDELIKQIRSAASEISLDRAARAFLYSVSAKDFRYRTALSSLIWANSMSDHECAPFTSYTGQEYYTCGICGGEFSVSDDLSCLKMEKYCRDRLIPQKNFMDICCAGYVLNDLREFAKLPDVSYCDEDIRMINRIFGLAGEISPANKVNALLKLISAEKSLDLTAADAYSVLGVLSSCGFFDTPDHKGYAGRFVPCNERQFVYETDIYYPLNFWRGKYGINYSAAEKIFGAEIAEKLSPETAIRGAAVREEPKKKPSGSKAEQYFTEGEHLIDLDDRMRYYYGLSPMDSRWDRLVKYSVTHSLRKRSEIYFEGNTVKKLIFEELAGENGYRYYLEADMDVPTNDRRLILPKTSRGREQPLTPSLLQTPAYMLGQLHVVLGGRSAGVMVFNSSNDQELPIPYRPIENKEDFEKFTEEYISSCPEDYNKILDNFRKKKRVTVKFTAGDIFRVQVSPTLYTYALILGKVRQLEKWKELPEEHPMRSMMTQPIIFRQYAIVTENPDMTAEELSKVPLLDVEFAQDNEILWETYPIVCSKKPEEKDIDLGFGINSSLKTVVWGLTVHTFV